MNGGNNLQRRLRTKFIALSVASFTVVMVIIIIAINVITAVKIDSHNNNILTALSENGGAECKIFSDMKTLDRRAAEIFRKRKSMKNTISTDSPSEARCRTRRDILP